MNLKNYNIEKSFFVEGIDGKKIFVYCWDTVSKPKAVIQIFHGMMEYGERYKSFAEYFNSKGFIVYSNDLRGHGRTASSVEELGYIGEDGFNKIVKDELIITKLINENHPKLPVIIYSHSFGSFIAQEYMINYGNYVNGVILAGSAARKGPEVAAGKIVAYLEKLLFGNKKKSRLLTFLTFFNHNKKVKNNTSKFSWLTRNLDEIKKFEEDELCGAMFSAEFYYYFFSALCLLYKKERLSRIPVNLPILIISGTDDPVGSYGSFVKKLYKIYSSTGIEDVKIKLYENARHELVHETNRDEIFSDITKWIDAKINV